MNIYAIIILSALIFEYVFDLITEILNLKALESDLPDEFKDVWDEDQYQKSQEYTRVNIKFGIMTSSLSLILTLVFWFAGGFQYLDSIVRQWELSMIWRGLCYIGILILLRSFFSLPFAIYKTFVIEEKFGFNKTTWKTFVSDMIKGLALAVILGAPILAGVLAFFQYAGNYAWFYAWMVTTLFTLIIQYVAPRWIMPLFNKFEPLEEGELKSEIMDYADSVDYRLEGVYVMDGSRRSSKSNAFFTGFGKNKRIALFDTLIDKHTIPELLTVLAHEIGHFKKKHILKGLIISIIHSGVVFYLLSIFLNHKGLYDAFYMEHQSIYAGLIFFGLLYSPIEFILSIFMQLFSRKHEIEADEFVVRTTDKAESFISALKKLSANNLSNLRPHPLYVFFNYSHPPILQRIKHIKKLAKSR
ncbi:M48 family metalloprotease [candidate division KSB1 bacterium]|nr:M48 family metalloprotease [candidate division KSB1 bacterium]